MPHSVRYSDRAMQLCHLKQAEEHVAQGERRITEQQLRVMRLARGGHNETEARKLLNNFYASQALFIEHRDRIRKELEP